MAKKGGLGKGLNALFEDNSTQTSDTVRMVRLSEIEPNREQPRKDFDEEALAQLADSIREQGVIQPLIVRLLPGGTYQIVAGERRWRVSRMLGLEEVPVLIRDLNDQETAEIALIENLQREDLNPMEEAWGYRELMERFGLTQEDISKRVGKSRPAVANALRLLHLPEEVSRMVRTGAISSGHARAALAAGEEAEVLRWAKTAAEKGWSVRELEKAVKAEKTAGSRQTRMRMTRRDSFYDEMELALKEELHRKVKIDMQENKGTITIEFYSREELTDLAQRLTSE